MQTRPSKRMGYRALTVLGAIALAFLVCVGSLVYVSLIHGEEYRLKAEKNQLSDTTISAERGTIYDSNMKVLAKSASAWLIYLNPSKIKDDAQRDLIVKNLSVILNIDEETLRKKSERTTSGYEKIAGEVETDIKDKLKTFISENKLTAIIGIDPDTKRYYPYSSFASSIIGFTDADDNGRLGLELRYNLELTGVAGRMITAKNARQGSMSTDYQTTYDAKAGNSLVLTIDEVVQYYLEQSLDQALVDTGAKYAYGIVMNVKTGAILGMTSKPDFDLNSPNTITNQQLISRIEAVTDPTEKKTETTNSLYAQWRNRTISDTYEPGSVFKPLVIAAALEEGVVNENTTYTCKGGIQVANHYQKCWKEGGHGTENLTQGLMNSCNPFLITIGQKMGKEDFHKYFEAFGLTEKTGIDLPAEAAPKADVTYHSLQKMGISELSSSSFGQTFQVSPIQVITAISAIANGGKLMQPYVVSSMLDGGGNVIMKTTPTVKRQVISQKTASLVAGMMEQVVSAGTGKNAYIAGYHVAGKTGTSEKIGKEGAYIASFAGFAPTNDPEIAILIAIDEPVGAHGGSVVAAPIAGDVLEKVLTHLNIEPQYDEKEMANITAVAPDITSLTLQDAKEKASKYTVKFIGNGTKVVSQMPSAGQQMKIGGVIVAYTDNTSAKLTSTVPNLTNMSVSQANKAAVNAGYNIKIAGNASASDFISYKQGIAAGTQAEQGTVITVYFRSTVNVQDGPD